MKLLLLAVLLFFLTAAQAQKDTSETKAEKDSLMVMPQEDTTIYGFRGSEPELAAQVEPSFLGGDQMLTFYIRRDLIYPKDAKKKNIEGTVILDFVIEKTGWSDQIKIVQSVYPSIDAEAIRLVRKLNWIPAAQNGHDVRYRERRSIDFDLDSQ